MYLFIFLVIIVQVEKLNFECDLHFIRISQGVLYHLNLYVQQIIDIDDYIMREKELILAVLALRPI